MKQENIKAYIEMAIENEFTYFGDFRVKNCSLCGIISPPERVYLITEIGEDSVDILRLITSKPFIEAIARGLPKEKEINVFGYEATIQDVVGKEELLQMICTMQAMAIMNGTMDEYIENLLNK